MKENISERVYQKLDEITGLLLGGKLSIFFGSGISVYSPSNLPTGGSLRRAIFEEIFNTKFTVDIRGNILKKKEYRETNEKLLKGKKFLDTIKFLEMYCGRMAKFSFRLLKKKKTNLIGRIGS